MKKLFLVMGLSAAVCFCMPTDAQAEMGLHLGVEGAFVLPMGDWADQGEIGLGGMVRAGYEAMDGLQLTLQIGYIYHLAKDVLGTDYNLSEMPILFGARYTHAMGLFGQLAIGPVNLGVSAGDHSDSEMKFGMLVGAGFSFASLSLAANLFLPDLGEAGDIMALMFTVGWDFLVL